MASPRPKLAVHVTKLASILPAEEAPVTPSHHIGTPPTSFQNPWPSFRKFSRWDALQARFSSDRTFVPVPQSREELVPVRPPDWGAGKNGLKATWIGHASFLIETATLDGHSRGIRILFDPVWSERTSPVNWAGPKRYTPTPCTLEEVPDIDIVVISHNHYDHLDSDTIRRLYLARKRHIHFFCPLGIAAWFMSMDIAPDEVTELDWWQRVRVDVNGAGNLELTCTPAQHFSGRSGWDMGTTLWSSWVVVEPASELTARLPSILDHKSATSGQMPRKVFFAGDTGYRAILSTDGSEASLPHCPVFSQIGDLFGSFDLALLPIGLYSPRQLSSSIHCSPEDSICVHKDIKSKRSIGMHWGTVRGGLSQYYEDVREPPRRWREAAEKSGLKWGEDVGLLDIGETLVIE